MPSIVAFVSRGSVPRTWTYLPSPSSRSRVKAGDDVVGEDLNNVVGSTFAIDCFGFAGGAVGGDQHLKVDGGDREFDVYGSGLPGDDIDRF